MQVWWWESWGEYRTPCKVGVHMKTNTCIEPSKRVCINPSRKTRRLLAIATIPCARVVLRLMVASP